MSAILEEGIGYGGSTSSTDVIISHYEDKLNASIASKTLKASKEGYAPVFTQEELGYLNKKSIEDAELKVITPSPTITLKKGNTEINIKNAAVLVQKMEEKYPTQSPLSPVEDGGGIKDRFKKLVNFDTKNVSSEVAKCVTLSDEPDNFPRDYLKEPKEKPFVMPNIIPASPPEKSVNKNAYEIRTDVLSMALDWVKFKKDSNQSVSSVSDDDVLSTAQKFYKFVENRR